MIRRKPKKYTPEQIDNIVTLIYANKTTPEIVESTWLPKDIINYYKRVHKWTNQKWK